MDDMSKKPLWCDLKMARQSGVFFPDKKDRISSSKVLAFLRLSTVGMSWKLTCFSLETALKKGSAQAS